MNIIHRFLIYYCIEQYKKEENTKIIQKIKEMFSYIIIEKKEIKILNEYKEIILLKIKNNKKRTIKKLEKILKKNKETKAILEKKYEGTNVENKLIENDIKIIDGKSLFVELLNEEIISYICRMQKRKMNTVKITILTNEYILRNEKLIKELSKKIKLLIVYTNRIEKFKNIEKILSEKYGINIMITNNKQLIEKSDIYINLDLEKEIIEKLDFNKNGIFINTYYKFTYDNKKFNGINIIDYEIKFPIENIKLKEILSKYENKKIVEYLFDYKKNVNLKKIKINYLEGKNGKLMSGEFYKVFLENRKNGRK